jgi:hypothetical protein
MGNRVQTVTLPKREEGPRLKRMCTRMVQPTLHDDDDHAANYVGDIEAMLNQPDFLNEKDIRSLNYLLRVGLVVDEEEPGGMAILLTGKKWGAFVGIRRSFLNARREHLFAKIRSRIPNLSRPDY